jgi:hypothetical protein
MRELAALLFGAEPGEPRAVFGPKRPGNAPACGAPIGDWCQTPPGDAALKWLDGTLREGDRARVHPRRGAWRAASNQAGCE